MPKNYGVLLLDFGGVCLLNPVELHAVTEQRLGLAHGTLDWLGPLDPSTDELWQKMTAGDGLTEREYWSRRAADVGAVAGVELDRDAYMRLMYEPPRDQLVRGRATQVATAAKAAGYTVAMLTNDMRAFHGRDWERHIAFVALMDEVIDCSDHDFLKPDPRAYQLALEATGAAPDRVLFVDDQPANVDGALAVGMDAVWFDIADAERAWDSIAERLGLTA